MDENWSVIGNLRSVHMDPEHWIDPDNFRPERFIDQDGNFIDDPWLMPFGAGIILLLFLIRFEFVCVIFEDIIIFFFFFLPLRT